MAPYFGPLYRLLRLVTIEAVLRRAKEVLHCVPAPSPSPREHENGKEKLLHPPYHKCKQQLLGTTFTRNKKFVLFVRRGWRRAVSGER
ncbi:hypothetical protein E2C01_082098 [Portunus trituberculatus]|uniref:Uncharacterized protein n=1 Tax=Portunus trituberculatus TaxID=210409 RepID=A0A5B7IP27_PORTR|nr:hypothetical protein [Portunus trituberculatus]